MFCCLRTCLNGNVRKAATTANRSKDPEIHLDPGHMGTDVILLSNQMRITGSGGVLATAPLVQSKSYFEVKIQQGGSWSVGLATRQADLNRKQGGSDKESWCLCSDNAVRHNNEVQSPVVVATVEPKGNANPILINGDATVGLIGIEDVAEDLLAAGNSSNNKENLGDKESTSAEATLHHDPAQSHQEQHRAFPDEGDIVGVAFDHIELNFYFNGKNLDVPFRNVKGSAVYPVIYVSNGAILDIILDNFQYGPPAGFDRIMIEQSLL